MVCKISKRYPGSQTNTQTQTQTHTHTHTHTLTLSNATFGKDEKLTLLKIHFHVFHIKLRFLHLISNKLYGVSIKSLTWIVALL